MIPSFLFWALLAPQTQERIRLHATGSTVLGIKQSVFRKIKLPVPQIGEQEVIAEALDEVQSQVRLSEDYGNELCEIKRGLMQDLLTGRVRVKGVA